MRDLFPLGTLPSSSDFHGLEPIFPDPYATASPLSKSPLRIGHRTFFARNLTNSKGNPFLLLPSPSSSPCHEPSDWSLTWPFYLPQEEDGSRNRLVMSPKVSPFAFVLFFLLTSLRLVTQRTSLFTNKSAPFLPGTQGFQRSRGDPAGRRPPRGCIPPCFRSDVDQTPS